MKQITRITQNTRDNAIKAVNNTLDIMDMSPIMNVALIAGSFIVDGNKGMTVWTDGKDVFATPDWALDWTDGEWSGISANGQSFTIENCEPKVEII